MVLRGTWPIIALRQLVGSYNSTWRATRKTFGPFSAYWRHNMLPTLPRCRVGTIYMTQQWLLGGWHHQAIALDGYPHLPHMYHPYQGRNDVSPSSNDDDDWSPLLCDHHGSHPKWIKAKDMSIFSKEPQKWWLERWSITSTSPYLGCGVASNSSGALKRWGRQLVQLLRQYIGLPQLITLLQSIHGMLQAHKN